MRASVVINTYNRAHSLLSTLRGLQQQTHDDFEVIVVKGPCTDNTDDVLAKFPHVRIASCPELKLSKSRNIGIATAASDIVAFIDDDAIPEPNWLCDLLIPYQSAATGAAGGLVYAPSGFELQYRYAVCDRTGAPNFEAMPPFDAYLRPGADPHLYLQGTNTSFRRTILQEIGGFDEEIGYYYDDVEVCLQIIDHGRLVVPLPNAIVHHKTLSSTVRNHKGVCYNPYTLIKDRYYFALRNGTATRPLCKVLTILADYANWLRVRGEEAYAQGDLSAEQFNFYLQQVERGIRVGLDRGLNAQRFRQIIPPLDSSQFVNFPTVRPTGKRLTICILSQDYPPDDFGGVGRFSCDMATSLAARGHEVHVVTRSPDVNRVDFEDGVWLHRLEPARRTPADQAGIPLTLDLEIIAGAYHEVCRIHERGPVDIVTGPLWRLEGLLCGLDGRFPTVLTLMSSLKTIAGFHPSWDGRADVRQRLALEGVGLRKAEILHPISAAILDGMRKQYVVTAAHAAVVPLGIRDRVLEYVPQRRAGDGRVQVLFVGRLERRKGVDLLLDAAVRLMRENPCVDFIFAGKHSEFTEIGKTYREWYDETYGHDPALAGRVIFTGAVSEDQLYQLYCDCDVFCLPSRYESFGLVLLEAMMFGKPVVGVRIGGMQEIVEVNGNGFLADAESAASLEECLRPLINDAGLRERYGRRSREIFATKFSAEIMAANTEKYYADMAARYPRARAMEPRPERLACMVRELAGIIGEVTGLPSGSTQRMAQAFLSPHKLGLSVDYRKEIKGLLPQPAGKFISGLYQVLFNRLETPQELADGLRQLDGGTSRDALVWQLTTCAEAKAMGLPSQGLTPHAPVASWMRRHLSSLPLARKAHRYLNRVLSRAKDFARTKVNNQKQAVRMLLHRQSCELLAVMGAQMHDLRTELVRLQALVETRNDSQRRRDAA